jgi:signal transduction histidine kinase
MKARSLRLRLMVGGIVAILIALTVAGAGLVFLFERHVIRTIGDDLNIYLNQLIAGIDVDAQARLVLTRPPVDPRFSEPLSGLYWQIGDNRGQMLRSRSLWDTVLTLARDNPAPGEIHRHVMAGPSGSRVLAAERVVTLTAAGQRVPVRIVVAADLGRVANAAAGFSRDLALALGLLGLTLAVATIIQVGLGLQPLAALRRGVADIRAGRVRNLAPAAPVEVQPLVEEINALVDAQEQEIERSRGRAADLAHGLKTPLAALSGDTKRLRESGQEAIARDIESVADAMSRHVDRELARARARGFIRRRSDLATELAPLVRSLIGTLARAPTGSRVSFEQQIVEGLSIPMDRTDLAEVLGNILDNAAQHAATQVCITATTKPSGPSIIVEDDGPGVPPDTYSRVMERGMRLDEREGSSAGLGLAIVQDVLEAYGWQIALSASDRLGGLKVTIAPA